MSCAWLYRSSKIEQWFVGQFLSRPLCTGPPTHKFVLIHSHSFKKGLHQKEIWSNLLKLKNVKVWLLTIWTNIGHILSRLLSIQGKVVVSSQCEQIVRFIALWTTFQSLWQQLICPFCTHFRQFYKGVKIFHFSSGIIFGQLL